MVFSTTTQVRAFRATGEEEEAALREAWRASSARQDRAILRASSARQDRVIFGAIGSTQFLCALHVRESLSRWSMPVAETAPAVTEQGLVGELLTSSTRGTNVAARAKPSRPHDEEERAQAAAPHTLPEHVLAVQRPGYRARTA